MVNIRPKAEVDLLEIWEYIFGNHDAARADTFLDQVYQTCQALEQFPELGRSREALAPGLRRATISSFTELLNRILMLYVCFMG
jgi:plasmid stabilization system protein ParE